MLRDKTPRRGTRNIVGDLILAISVVGIALMAPLARPLPAEATVNTARPAAHVKLIFIHHSTGQAWLDDGYGRLGLALRDNNYFVSDTNYGWGPDRIGDSTDLGHWWTWFRGPSSSDLPQGPLRRERPALQHLLPARQGPRRSQRDHHVQESAPPTRS